MIEIVFIIALIICGLVLFIQFKATNTLKSKVAQLEDDLMIEKAKTSAEHEQSEQLKYSNIQLSTQLESLTERLDRERTIALEKQKELKEQLELVGNELINKGTKQLKTENIEGLSSLLLPFKEKLTAFEKEVRDNSKKDIERFAAMEAVVKSLSEQHAKMNNTAQNLVDALRGEQKVQGDWGELALERILESSGLENGREYETQSTYKDENGRLLRPDVVIHLPENKHIIIDSKVSLKAFEQYINSDNANEKKLALSHHILSVKNHIKQLGDKNYNYLPGIESPDFVLMFLPLESSFALAIKEEPDLYQMAWDKKVVLVTPSTLLATLKTVSSIWKQEKQNKNALEIATQASRLYDKFIGFISDMEQIGKKQKDAMEAYDGAMNKLSTGKGNLVRSAEKLKELGVKSKKQLDQKFLQDELDQDD